MGRENEGDMGQQRATEAFAHLRAILRSGKEGQPLPTPPAWLVEDMRRAEAEKAAEYGARHTATVAEIFGRVKAYGPFTASEARVGFDDRAASRDDPEAQAQPETEIEDYEI